jgi:hypothetical protein
VVCVVCSVLEEGEAGSMVAGWFVRQATGRRSMGGTCWWCRGGEGEVFRMADMHAVQWLMCQPL